MVRSWPSIPIVLPTRSVALLLSLPLALACSPEGPPPPSGTRPPERAIYSEVGEAYCFVAFSPDEALRPATELAAARWSLATGCEVVVAEGGVPLVSWSRLFVEYTSEGRALLSAINHGGTMKSLCGLSTWTDDESAVRIIDISLACDEEDAVAHEMGHALARLRRHSFTGVMASGDNPARSPIIDAASLELVCYELPCANASPEG